MGNQPVPKSKTRWYLSWWMLIIYFIVAAFVMSRISGSSNPVPTSQPVAMGPSLGSQIVLKLPNNNDSSQVICLGPTKESYSQITKSIMTGDTLGLLEIPGAFCVSNGSKAKLIDQAVAVRRVRIEEGVRPVDSDKIGLSGWVAKEFISAN